MSEELKEILCRLNQFRDLIAHEGLCLKQDEVEAYKANVANEIDKLINEVANGENTRTEPVLPLQNVMQRVLQWWEKLPDNLNGDISKYQYAYRHFERHWMSLTYREIEKIYGIEHVA